MALKSIAVSKLMFWVSQDFAIVAHFIITSLSKHRLKPSHAWTSPYSRDGVAERTNPLPNGKVGQFL